MEMPLRLEVPIIETLKENESNEEGEDKVEDGCGLMLEAVIEGPMSDQGVEQIIFDIPASMSDTPEQTRGHLRHGKRRYPPPVMDLRVFDPLVVLTVPYGHRLFCVENP
jgi:hypothetical protein